MKEKFDVIGMSCSACSSKIEKEVGKLKGMNKIQVNLLTNSMTAEFDEKLISAQDIIKKVDDLGYGAAISGKMEENTSAPKKDDEVKNMKIRLWVSFGFLIPLMYVSMGHMVGLPLPFFLDGMTNAVSFAFAQFLLAIPILYINRKFFSIGFKALWKRSPNMDSLVAVGSSAALLYGIVEIFIMSYGLGAGNMELIHKYHMDLYFESSAMILALITLGKFLELRSKGKTGEAIKKLMDLSPKTALILDDNGEEKEIESSKLMVGDIVIVKPGMTVPADGIVVDGWGDIDESMLTGESLPVEKKQGDKLTAATVNKSGFLKFQATKVGEDTDFYSIIKLVEEASAQKAPISRLADKISGIFVPVVMVIAVLSFAVWLMLGYGVGEALSFGICVLVISCPCALGLATPVAIMVGTGKGAENGILIKSGEALEVTHKINTIVFDKTGTITMGQPEITEVYGEKGLEEVAYSLELGSEHPLAKAVVNYSKDKGISYKKTDEFRGVSGSGIIAKIDGVSFIGGSMKYLEECGIDTDKYKEKAKELYEKGNSVLAFATKERMIGIMAAADKIKPDAQMAISELHKMNIETVMLTGDNELTAKATAKKVGIDRVVAGVKPEGKEQEVSAIKAMGKKVAMVGDGINDAPALASADVGIAIGAGTDVAIESADVVLMGNRLSAVVSAVKLSGAVVKNIKENLFWAFFYNVIGIPIAAGLLFIPFGIRLSPMLGALAMSLSSLCVVGNALRLRGFKVKLPEINDRKELKVVKEERQEIKMIKMTIDGMMCMHCVGNVKKALSQIGIEADVNLDEKCAYLPQGCDIEKAKAAVIEAGYQEVEIN